MATPIQEPSDIPQSHVTDENAHNLAVLVYEKAADSAGLKKLGLAEWKNFLGYNAQAVKNLGTLVGYPESQYYTPTPIDPPTTTLLQAVQGICDQVGVSFNPPSTISSTINSRLTTVEGTASNLSGRMTTAEDKISNLESFIGNVGSTSTPPLANRVVSLENTSSTLEDYVKDGWTDESSSLHVHYDGLLTRTLRLENFVGNSTNGMVKNVNDLMNWVSTGWTEEGTEQHYDGLLNRTKIAEENIGSLTTDVNAIKQVIGAGGGGGGTEGLQGTVTNLVTFTGIPSPFPSPAPASLNSRLTTAESNISSNTNDISQIKNTLGSENLGLVGDIKSLKLAIGDITQFSDPNTMSATVLRINNILGTDNISGGNTVTRAINKLWEDVELAGGLKSVVGIDDNSGLRKRVGDLETTIGNYAITPNKTITQILGSNELYNNQSLTQTVFTLATDMYDSTNGLRNIVGTSTSTGLRGDVATLITTMGTTELPDNRSVTYICNRVYENLYTPTTGLVDTLANHGTRITTLENKLSSVYTFMGDINQTTVNNWDNVQTGRPLNGYVYNVTDHFTWWGSNDHSQPKKNFYKGENVAVVVGTNWQSAYLDSLGVSIDVAELNRLSALVGNSAIVSEKTISQLIGSTALTTGAETITGAIEELKTSIGTNTTNIEIINSTLTGDPEVSGDVGLVGFVDEDTALTTDARTVTTAINEIVTEIGTDNTSNTICGRIKNVEDRATALENKFTDTSTTSLGISEEGVYMITAYKSTGEIGVLTASLTATGALVASGKYAFAGNGTDTAATFFNTLDGSGPVALKSGLSAKILKL